MRRGLVALVLALAVAGCGGGEKPERKLFGFNSALSLWATKPSTEIRLERLVGANAQRYVAGWRDLQPRPNDPPLAPGGPRDDLDALYRELAKAEMTPIVIAGNAPPWAAPKADASEDWLAPDEAHVERWATFVRALAARYPKAVIEPWNEPNFGVFWHGAPLDPKLMARLQCAAYRAVPRKSTVLSTGFAVRPGFADYARAFMDAGGGRCFDALSVHIYAGGLQTARRYRQGKPIWITETGTSSVPGKLSERGQARANRKLYEELTRTKDVHAVLFNTLRDGRDPPLLNKPSGREYHFGFLRVDYTPKPVYCEFATTRLKGCVK